MPKKLTEAERVYRIIKNMITDKKLLPSQQLVETTLAAHCSASRTPVREAIRLLTEDGVVDVIPNRGAFVRAISKDEVIMCFEEAAALEAMAAFICAEKVMKNEISATEIEVLAQLVEQMDHLADEDDARTWLEVDEKFHHTIVHYSRNYLLLHHRNQMVTKLELANWYRPDRTPNYRKKSNVHHRKMYEAIVAGDKETAWNYSRDNRIETRDALYQ